MSRRLLPALAILGVIAATAFAAVQRHGDEQDAAERNTRTVVNQSRAAVEMGIGSTISSLRGASGIVSPDGEIADVVFRAYAGGVIRAGLFEALAREEIVTDAERDAFERRAKTRIYEKYGPRDARSRPRQRHAAYLPVVRVHPSTRDLVASIGFDFLSDPVRARAAASARDSAEPRMSAPLRGVVTEAVSVVVIQPLFKPGFPVRTVAQRRIALVGFVSGGVRGEDLGRSVAEQLPAGAELQIFDGASRLSGPEELPSGPVASAPVSLGGRDLRIVVGGIDRDDSSSVALIVLVGTALLFLIGAAILLAERAAREQARRAEREALVAAAAEALERETGAEERIGVLAQLLVPTLAEICVIDLVAPNGETRRAGVAAADPTIVARLRSTTPPPIDSSERGLKEGETRMIAPLVARSRTLGWMILSVTGGSGRRYTGEDLLLAREIARHAALSLDNAELFDQQRQIAATLQRALLPRSLPSPPGLEVAARYAPGAEGTEVGGDFYDMFEAGGGWMAFVGDVCGKGAQAAAVTALARHTLRATAGDGPAGALARLNDAVLSDSRDNTFCTVSICSIVPDGERAHVVLASAGHPEPILLRAGGAVLRPRVLGPFAGVLPDPRYQELELELEPGDALVLFTDGVTEARRDGELFGDERLEELVASRSRARPAALVAAIDDAVSEFAAGGAADDIAVLAIRFSGDVSVS